MDAADLFPSLGISLALGLLVGLQRQFAEPTIAGLRTFPLITLAGSLVALSDQALGASGWLLALGILAVAMLILGSIVQRLQGNTPDFGLTTEAALLLMFVVGAFAVIGERLVAVAAGAVTAALLQFKPELHGLVGRLGERDLRAIMTFALITCVILPVLPNRTYDLVAPLDILNPFEVWLMVVLMVGISLGGYLLYKFVGQSTGMLLSGVLGGAISSTATTLSYARRAADSSSSVPPAALVIMIASTVAFVRVLIEIAAVAPAHLTRLATPVVVMLISGLITVALMWLLRKKQTQAMPEQKNPTELKSAIMFAALYAGVLLALATAKRYFGGQGLYAVAILSGMTDMDAITLSTARMVQQGGLEPSTGWQLIVIASMSNLVFKGAMAAAIGGTALMWRLGLLFAVPLATGAALLVLFP